MTERRLGELLVGLKAHHGAIARASGDLAEHGNKLADLALRLDRMDLKFEARLCAEASAAYDRIAREFAAGLERLDRLAEPALEDTQPIDMGEVAAMNAEDAKD